MLPLAPESKKTRLLYRNPIAPARGHMLEVVAGSMSLFERDRGTGETSTFDASKGRFSAHLPFRDETFDTVVLHRVLEHLRPLAPKEGRAVVLDEFLAEVVRVLAPGGIVIGCAENAFALERMVRTAKHALGRGADVTNDRVSTLPLSVFECNRLLVRAGVSEIRLFGVLPSIDSPNKLIGLKVRWSRRACRRQVEAMRPLVSPTHYAVWRALAELGVSQYLGAATFFWGRRHC